MAKVKDGIFGGFSGRIGNLVGFFRNGKYHIRSVAANAKNPRTKAQQTHRGKFRLASKLVATVNPFIQKGFSTVAGTTPRGAAMSFNMRSAVAGEHPDLYIDDSGNLLFKWKDNSGEGNARADDRAMLLAVVPDKKGSLYKLKGAERSAEEDLIEFPASFDEQIYAYIAFISKNETLVSDSIYLPL